MDKTNLIENKKLKTQLLRHKQDTLPTFFDDMEKQLRKKQCNDIYQGTVSKPVGIGISTCYPVLRQLTRLVLLDSIVIFLLIFGPKSRNWI